MVTRSGVNLTVKAIEAMRPEAEPYYVPDLRCRPLRIRVAPSGLLTWDIVYRVKGGRVRHPSLGPYPAVTLEAARRRATVLKEAASVGRDLLQEEEDAKAAKAHEITVEDLVDRYSRFKNKAGLRTAAEIERRLRRSLAPLLKRRANDIRRRDIRELLDKVADSNRDREAEKRRQVIGAAFRWALARDMVDTDPTYGLPSYGSGAPRERTFDESEIRTFLDWLPVSTLSDDHVTVMRLQLLLGARCGEVSGMHRNEIDVDRWIWTLPAARSKNKRQRVTPLVGWAREIVRAALEGGRKGSLFLAESGAPLRATHVGQALIHRRKRCPLEHFTTHDLRRTFVSRMVDMGISIDLIAAIVGHESGGRETRTLMRHYVRTDQVERKRIALEAWHAAVQQLASRGVPAPNVHSLLSAAL